jgi:hypothetical protein
VLVYYSTLSGLGLRVILPAVSTGGYSNLSPSGFRCKPSSGRVYFNINFCVVIHPLSGLGLRVILPVGCTGGYSNLSSSGFGCKPSSGRGYFSFNFCVVIQPFQGWDCVLSCPPVAPVAIQI